MILILLVCFTFNPAWASERRNLTEQIKSLQTLETEMKTSLAAAVEDCKLQAGIARDAQARYEREVVLHSESIKQFSTSKSRIEELTRECAELKVCSC